MPQPELRPLTSEQARRSAEATRVYGAAGPALDMVREGLNPATWAYGLALLAAAQKGQQVNPAFPIMSALGEGAMSAAWPGALQDITPSLLAQHTPFASIPNLTAARSAPTEVHDYQRSPAPGALTTWEQLTDPRSIRLANDVPLEHQDFPKVSYSNYPSIEAMRQVHGGRLRPEDAQTYDHLAWAGQEMTKDPRVRALIGKVRPQIKPINTTTEMGRENVGLAYFNEHQDPNKPPIPTGRIEIAARYPQDAPRRLSLDYMTQTLAHEMAHMYSYEHDISFTSALNTMYPVAWEKVYSYPHLQQAGPSVAEVFPTRAIGAISAQGAQKAPLAAGRPVENEGELIARAKTGDQAAFGRLLTPSLYNKATRLATGILKNSDDAQDVVQEASLKALGAIKDFRGEEKFGTWFYDIVMNHALNVKRNRKPGYSLDEPLATEEGTMQRPELAAPTESPDATIDKAHVQRTILDALAGLSPEHRTAITLRHVEGLRRYEVANILGMTNPHTRDHLARATAAFQGALAGKLDWGDLVSGLTDPDFRQAVSQQFLAPEQIQQAAALRGRPDRSGANTPTRPVKSRALDLTSLGWPPRWK